MIEFLRKLFRAYRAHMDELNRKIAVFDALNGF